jgi:Putative DNA-binding domain
MRPINLWNESDLQFLIDNKLGETIVREYKQALDIDKPLDRKELCRYCSAFANSQGGIIIFGLQESDQAGKGSIPVALSPILDRSLKERAQQIILDGIQPKMDFRFYSIPDSKNQGEFIMIDIPKSCRGLHMVISGQDNRYYIRRDFQSVPMTPFEIEEGYRTYLRLEQSADERIARLGSRPFQNVLGPQPWAAWLEITAIPSFPIQELFVPICLTPTLDFGVLSVGMRDKDGLAGLNNFQPCYDGLQSTGKHTNGTILWDHVIYRDGGATTGIQIGIPSFHSQKLIAASAVLREIHNSIAFITGLFLKVGYASSLIANCTITKNTDFDLGVPAFVSSMQWDREYNLNSKLSFTHRLLFSSRSWLDSPSKTLEHLMHHLWQSFGYHRCHYYAGNSGEYDPKLLGNIAWIS